MSSIVRHVPHDVVGRIIVGWNAKEPLGDIDSGDIELSVVWETSTFNFAVMCNYLARFYAFAEVVLFMNDDVELVEDSITPCLKLIEHSEEIGTVGIKLLYPNKTIQHCGQFLSHKDGKFGGVGHLLQHQPDQDVPMLQVVGNTGAFLMLRRDLFWDVGGFDTRFRHCFEDCVLNYTVGLKGKMNVCNAQTWAWHKESVTRHQTICREDIELLRIAAEKYLKEKGIK